MDVHEEVTEIRELVEGGVPVSREKTQKIKDHKLKSLMALGVLRTFDNFPWDIL